MLPYTAHDLINAVNHDIARNDHAPAWTHAAPRQGTSWSYRIARFVSRRDRHYDSSAGAHV